MPESATPRLKDAGPARRWSAYISTAILTLALIGMLFLAWGIERQRRDLLPAAVWRDIVTLSPSAVLVLDTNSHVITEWSPAAIKFFGWLPEDVLGHDVLEFCEEADRANVKLALESQIFQQRISAAPLDLSGKIRSKRDGLVKVRGTLYGIPTVPARIVAVFMPTTTIDAAALRLKEQANEMKANR